MSNIVVAANISNISYLNCLGVALHLLQDHPHGGGAHNLLNLRIVHGSLANFLWVRAAAAILADCTVLVTCRTNLIGQKFLTIIVTD